MTGQSKLKSVFKKVMPEVEILLNSATFTFRLGLI